MTDLVETVAVVAEEVAGGFMRINKADFQEGVHKLFEGLTEAAEGAGEAVSAVFTAEAGGTVTAAADAGQGGNGGAPVASEPGAGGDGGQPAGAEAGQGGWGHTPTAAPEPPPVEPQEAAAAASEKPGKAK